MILPSSLFIDYLDYPLCFGYLIGMMFLLRPIACLLTLAFWISPLYVDRLDCYFGFDPLPAFSYVFVVTAFNKLLHMDSHSASASSLQVHPWFGRTAPNSQGDGLLLLTWNCTYTLQVFFWVLTLGLFCQEIQFQQPQPAPLFFSQTTLNSLSVLSSRSLFNTPSTSVYDTTRSTFLHCRAADATAVS